MLTVIDIIIMLYILHDPSVCVFMYGQAIESRGIKVTEFIKYSEPVISEYNNLVRKLDRLFN